MDVAIAGCGVIGLTTAVELAERGHRVRVFGRELPEATTSAVAAAIWYPYLASPRHRVLGWAAASLRRFGALAAEPAAGVSVVPVVECFRARAGEPWWRACVPSFRRAVRSELPPGYEAGHRFEAPLAEMPRYLPFLLGRLARASGVMERCVIADLDRLPGEVVVNCTGIGARTLCGDGRVRPVRGHVVRVEAGAAPCVLVDDADPRRPVYVIPRSGDCVVGGSADPDLEDEGDPAVYEEILRRAERLAPAVRSARVLGRGFGVRPARDTVRLEVGTLPSGRPVVHDYGHGGAGVTLSWGCAEDTAALIAGWA